MICKLLSLVFSFAVSASRNCFNYFPLGLLEHLKTKIMVPIGNRHSPKSQYCLHCMHSEIQTVSVFVPRTLQVLAKAAKVIPVMLMGRIVSRRSYSWTEYVTAIGISAGLFMFLLTSTYSEDGKSQDQATTTLSGLIILAGYLMFDSFTSNWQSELFQVFFHRFILHFLFFCTF